MIPMNFLDGGQSCDFTGTGTWSKKVYADAQKFGRVNAIFNGAKSGYTTMADATSL
jgi:phosphoserine aminotransferase